jgi:hypothetical protein
MAFVEGIIVAGVVFVLLGSMGLFRKNSPPEHTGSTQIFSNKSAKSHKSRKSNKSVKSNKSTKSAKSIKSSSSSSSSS